MARHDIQPGTLSGVLETRGGCLVPDVPPLPQLLPAPEADPVPGQSAVRVSDLLEKVLPPSVRFAYKCRSTLYLASRLVLNLASREDRWRSIQHVLRCAAPSVARWSAPSHSRRNRPSLPRRGGPHAAHLRHFGSGAAARFLTLNITLTRLLACGAAAFPALVIEDDAVLTLGSTRRCRLREPSLAAPASCSSASRGTTSADSSSCPKSSAPPAANGGTAVIGADWLRVGRPAATRAGAQLLVELMSAPQWVRSSAGSSAGRRRSPPIWCDGAPATEACAPRPHGERFLRHYGPDTCACRRFDKPDVWTAFTAARIAEPGAFVFFGADLRWGPTYKSIEKHRVGGGGILQCGLAIQARMGSDQRPDAKPRQPNWSRKAAGSASLPARARLRSGLRTRYLDGLVS